MKNNWINKKKMVRDNQKLEREKENKMKRRWVDTKITSRDKTRTRIGKKKLGKDKKKNKKKRNWVGRENGTR